MTDRGFSVETTKRCPYCAEEILGANIKCKNCTNSRTATIGLGTWRVVSSVLLGAVAAATVGTACNHLDAYGAPAHVLVCAVGITVAVLTWRHW